MAQSLHSDEIIEHLPIHKFSKPTWKKPPCVIIACGSFSPPTYLHLRLFEEAKNVLMEKYDIIGGILSPVHDEYGDKYKNSLKEVNGKHRVEMCRLATESSTWLGVSDWEALVRPDWTRVAVVMNTCYEALNGEKVMSMLCGKDYKNNQDHNSKLESEPRPKITLKFLCGGDLLDSFLVPNLWIDEHIKIILGYGIACIERENTNEREVIRKHEVLNQYAQNIDLIKLAVHNTVSSTIIRKLLKEKKSIKYLTDDLVIQYIERQQLYQPLVESNIDGKSA